MRKLKDQHAGVGQGGGERARSLLKASIDRGEDDSGHPKLRRGSAS